MTERIFRFNRVLATRSGPQTQTTQSCNIKVILFILKLGLSISNKLPVINQITDVSPLSRSFEWSHQGLVSRLSYEVLLCEVRGKMFLDIKLLRM